MKCSPALHSSTPLHSSSTMTPHLMRPEHDVAPAQPFNPEKRRRNPLFRHSALGDRVHYMCSADRIGRTQPVLRAGSAAVIIGSEGMTFSAIQLLWALSNVSVLATASQLVTTTGCTINVANSSRVRRLIERGTASRDFQARRSSSTVATTTTTPRGVSGREQVYSLQSHAAASSDCVCDAVSVYSSPVLAP